MFRPRSTHRLAAATCALSLWSGTWLRAQTLEWFRQVNDSDRAHAVATDRLGNVYLAGTTHDADVFLGKSDAAGNFLWTATMGTPNQDQAFDVSADGLGNVYTAGEYWGGEIANDAGWDAFVTKYDECGNLAWFRRIESDGDERARGVSADGRGNIYVSGSTQGNLGEPSAGGYDAFVSKYDASGNAVWIRQIGTSVDDGFRGVSADILGNVYISGGTRGDLGGPNAGDWDAFVSKYDAAGNLLWTRQLGTAAEDLARSAATDGLGNVYVAGYTAGNLGGPNAGFYDVFVSKYDTAGNLLWVRQLGTSADEGGCCRANPGEGGSGTGYVGVTADGLGNVYLASGTNGSLGGPNAGGVTSPPYRWDGFVSKLDDAGNFLWTQQFGTAAWEFATDVSADGLGNVYVSGTTQCFSTQCTLDGSNAFWVNGLIAKFRDDVVAPVPGDFNYDGMVDATDYVVWRNGIGTVYTQADYDVWRTHFGQTSGSGSSHAAIPEPATAVIALFTPVPLVLWYRAHHAGLPAWKAVFKPERTVCQPPLRSARRSGAMFPCPRCDQHLRAQTSCEMTRKASVSASGFQTSAHRASSVVPMRRFITAHREILAEAQSLFGNDVPPTKWQQNIDK